MQVVLLPDVTATSVVEKHALIHLPIGTWVRAPVVPFYFSHNLLFQIQCKQARDAHGVPLTITTLSSHGLILRI